jgi:hypothetical protein
MGKNTKSAGPAAYLHLWRWATEYGTFEIGHCDQTHSFIRVLDEGGIIWKGRRSYARLDVALADADAGVARWMRDELGITGAT